MKSNSTNGAEKRQYSIIASAKRNLEGQVNNGRGIGGASEQSNGKRAKMNADKLFPLFNRQTHQEAIRDAGDFIWHTAIGTDKTCLKATYKAPFSKDVLERKSGTRKGKAKIACFDLDGCLVRPKNGKSFPSASDEYDYEEAFRGAFARVKKEYNDGSSIVIISNQKQSSPGPSKKLETWKRKLKLIAHAIDCPLLILAALSNDGFRKPGRLSWDHGVIPAYLEAGGQLRDIEIEGKIEDQATFFVGDAAGRVGDHSDTDRKWAINVGIPFYTPEEYFYGEKARSFTLSGFKPSLDLNGDTFEPLPSTYFPSSPSGSEIVLFVGPPAAGKTTFYKTHFSSRQYRWVNQDTLKSAGKCLSTAKEHLLSHHSVVIDNTNRNKITRAPYIALAKEVNATIRCIFFDVSHELCVHNSLYRVRAGLQPPEEERKVLPELAFLSYFNNLEIPTRDEGFDADVLTVQWSFQGDDEAKRRWLKHWQ